MSLAPSFTIAHVLTHKIQVRSASCTIAYFLAGKIQLEISSCTIDGLFSEKIQVMTQTLQHSAFSFPENTSLCILLISPRCMLQQGRRHLYLFENFQLYVATAIKRLYFINFAPLYVATGRKQVYLFEKKSLYVEILSHFRASRSRKLSVPGVCCNESLFLQEKIHRGAGSFY